MLMTLVITSCTKTKYADLDAEEERVLTVDINQQLKVSWDSIKILKDSIANLNANIDKKGEGMVDLGKVVTDLNLTITKLGNDNKTLLDSVNKLNRRVNWYASKKERLIVSCAWFTNYLDENRTELGMSSDDIYLVKYGLEYIFIDPLGINFQRYKYMKTRNPKSIYPYEDVKKVVTSHIYLKSTKEEFKVFKQSVLDYEFR